MHDEAMSLPLNIFVEMPSCVPSAPGLEQAGASLGPDDVREAMSWPNIIGPSKRKSQKIVMPRLLRCIRLANTTGGSVRDGRLNWTSDSK